MGFQHMKCCKCGPVLAHGFVKKTRKTPAKEIESGTWRRNWE